MTNYIPTKNITMNLWLLILLFTACSKKETLSDNDIAINSAETISIMTYNISQPLHHDKHPESPHYWPTRKSKVIDLLKKYNPDILCAQEDNPIQITAIKEALNYEKYGVSKYTGIDGDTGPYNAVFYNPKRFSVKESGHFWFSETPEIPSRSWDSSIYTLCTWVKMYDNVSKKDFYVYNNHFDHEGNLTRKNSALMLKERISAKVGTDAVLVTGDMNCYMNSQPVSIFNSFLSNAQSVSTSAPKGPTGTFNNFLVSYDINKYRLDYIFVNKKVKVLTHEIITDSYYNQYYPSDHFPILSKFQLTP